MINVLQPTGDQVRAFRDRATGEPIAMLTLLMFTDGLSDCLRTGRMWSDELLTDVVSKATAASSDQVLDSLFDLAAEPDGGAVDDRTALVVK